MNFRAFEYMITAITIIPSSGFSLLFCWSRKSEVKLEGRPRPVSIIFILVSNAVQMQKQAEGSWHAWIIACLQEYHVTL